MATFNGTEGNDTITGGADSDVINGNGGNDSLLGGDGSDTVRGGAGNDFLSGNAGTDWVEGGTGNDEVRGGSGQDSIAFHEFGTANADILSDFDAGWDNIQLDASAFTAIGVAGRMAAGDARFFSGTAAHDADDRIIYNQATGQIFYDADGNGAGAAQLIATISNHSALSATDIWVFGSAPAGQTINGTAGDDTLVGTSGDDTINGLGGNDSLVGGDGNDSLNGGDGNDTLDGGTGTDTLNGGLGDDTYLNPQDDTILDAGGVDTEIVDNVGGLLMAPGIENLIVRGHTDRPDPTVTGNELDNRIVLETDRGYWVNGGGGDDTILGSDQADIYTLGIFPSGEFGHDVIDGRGGIDILLANTSGDATIDMRAGTGSISTAPASSVSFTSIEKLYGAGGNDLLIADDGGRSLAGQAGNDTLIGGSGNDTLGGDATFDFPSEPVGLDSLVGGAGNDQLNGGRGNDTLDGGTGNDSLFGGNDNDIFRFSVTPGAANADVISDFQSGMDSIVLDSSVMTALGASGSFSTNDGRFYAASGATSGHDADDRVVYDTSTNNLYYDADGSGAGSAQLIATLPAWFGAPLTLAASDIAVDTVTAPRNQTFDGTTGNDSITGGGGNDFMFGGDGNDTLNGGDGNDSIFGQAGDDSLIGGAGLDSLNGGDGNDTLDGTTGSQNGETREADTLDGGAGDDVYIVGGNDVIQADPGGIDTVRALDTDWTLGAGLENLIVLNSVRMTNTTATGNELNNIIDTPGVDHGGTIHGMGGDDTIFAAQHQDGMVFGDDGNDVLHGETATSTNGLDGGAGNDTLIASRSGALIGGSGGDSFVFNSDLTLGGSTIADFASSTDKIHLDARVMTALGASGNLAADDPRFYSAAGATSGHDADDRVIYNTSTGQLFYDADGSGSGAARLITIVSNGSAPATVLATDIAVDNGTTPTPTPTPIPAGSIVGTNGNDNLNGTNGNDSIFGLAGNDTIFANGGNDWVQGGAGNDSVSGGSGQDQYAFAEFGTANADQILNFGSGWDGIQLDAAGFGAIGTTGRFSSGDVRFFAAAGATSGHDADDRIVYNTSTGQLFYDADGNGAGASQLIATFQGNPAIAATDINVFGSATPSPTPTPTPGTINGTEGNDSLVGTDAPDTINGFGGNDTIDGRGGADSMVGGSGDDLYFVDNPGDVIVEQENGGIDEVRSTANNYLLPSWVNNLTLLDGAVFGTGNDIENVITGNALDNSLSGQRGDDRLDAGDGTDTLFGGAGNDTLLGGAGTDFFFQTFGTDPSPGNDVIDGGADFDWLRYDLQSNVQSGVVVNLAAGTSSGSGVGGAGSATLTSIEAVVGTNFADVLTGDATANVLQGGDGNDTLRAGGAPTSTAGDQLQGGAGADVFVMDTLRPNGNAASVVVIDFTTGEDTVRLDGALMPALGASGRFAADDPRFYAAAGASTGHDADDRIVYNTSSGQLYYDPDGSGAQNSFIIAQLNVPGSPVFPPAPLAAGDIEVVNGINPTPTPTPGTSLNGTSGNDTLVGGAGNDTIFGNSGNDWIEGRGGNDQLSGGSGQDSYVFREFGTANADTLLQFDSSWDAMRFDSSAFTALGGAGHFASGDARFYAAAGATGGHDADDRMVYNTSTGQLYYDADGAGGADAQLVATVQGAGTVAASDIWVI